jgi:hypothetical protein
MSPVEYFLFRSWMTRNGKEALAAFLEDVITYRDIGVPVSRSKW